MTASSLLKHASTDLSGSVFLIDGAGKILSLPIPSRSTRDPLNWSTRKRGFAIFSLIFFATVGLIQLLGLSLVYTSIAKEYSTANVAPFRLEWYITAPSLAMGLGGFLWVPLSLAIGRRPVFLLTSSILAVATIWASFTTSFQQILAAVCLQGLAVSLKFSSMLLMIIDLTFIYQRPQAIAMVWSLVTIFSLAFQVGIPATIQVEWRTFYRMLIVPCGAAFLLAFFCYPETYFYRPAIAFNGHVLVQSATEKIQIYEDWEEVPGGKPLPNEPFQSRWRRWMSEYSFLTKMPGGWRNMGVCYIQIVMALTNPLIVWVALLNLLIFGGTIVILTTYASLLVHPPYDFSLLRASLSNLATIIGALLAWPAAGIMTTQLCHRLVMRNGGVRDAEHYLPAFILPILSAPVSLVIYGFAGERGWHWFWIFFSMGLNSFACVTLFTVTTLWVTEAFPRWAAPAMVIVGSGSYAASFALSSVMVPRLESQGFARTLCLIGILIFGVGSFAFPVAMWGRRYRYYVYGKWALHEGGSLRPQVRDMEV